MELTLAGHDRGPSDGVCYEVRNLAESPDSALLKDIETHAVEIARGAGAMLERDFGSSVKVEYKDEAKRDPVTQVDKEVQAYLKEAILDRFPDHGVLGEEGRDEEGPAQEFMWVLDPLDGTKNYISGLPIYSSSIGVMHRANPIAGALYVPWPSKGNGVVLHARTGGGAFIDEEPVSVADSPEPRGNALAALPGYWMAMLRFAKPMRGKVGDVRVTGSIAYELAMTAKGVFQYTITLSPHLWDIAAGAVIVGEAGGLVMLGHRSRGLRSLVASIRWEPAGSLVPSWRDGETTLADLRNWSMPMAFGARGPVRYVTSNIRSRSSLRRRISRTARGLVRRKDH